MAKFKPSPPKGGNMSMCFVVAFVRVVLKRKPQEIQPSFSDNPIVLADVWFAMGWNNRFVLGLPTCARALF